jgi:tRNA-dihydrouridine synthase B
VPTPLRIGAHTLANRLFVAPMAGVTDRPFRMLCRRLGAGHAVSEMVTSKRELWHTLKTSRRADHAGEPGPIAVQIAGVDPAEMAEAALYNIDRGAQIIDINMGCPAKKVCKVWAGSALMQNERLALAIVDAVVAACAPRGVPVTLKMRTGWCAAVKNAPLLARAAQEAGVAMLTVHGRTREQGYGGTAEHDTVAAIKAELRIPVVANGDIASPERAAEVLRATGCDAVMIGRAAQGRPWIFGDIAHFLQHGTHRLPRCAAGCSSTWTTISRCMASSPACAAPASTSAGPCAACPVARLCASASTCSTRRVRSTMRWPPSSTHSPPRTSACRCR